ncbi:MAG: hypothetical protein WAX66_00055 [Patescibacteria group bacterium]
MPEEIKNEHLKPVFNEIIPAITSLGIKYWVYGGVAIAGIKGKFDRKNADVDIFVQEKDFETVSRIVSEYANKREGIIPVPTIENGRPKIELKPKGSRFDWFSAVPVYEVGDKIEFRFKEKSKLMDMDVLKEVERKVNNYTFITPSDYHIKELFKHYLKTKRLMEKNKIDSENFLDASDLQEIFKKDSI